MMLVRNSPARTPFRKRKLPSHLADSVTISPASHFEDKYEFLLELSGSDSDDSDHHYEVLQPIGTLQCIPTWDDPGITWDSLLMWVLPVFAGSSGSTGQLGPAPQTLAQSSQHSQSNPAINTGESNDWPNPSWSSFQTIIMIRYS